MINISMLVDHVKGRMGASHRKIELDDDMIIQCLCDTTLKTLSIFAPYYCTTILDLKENEVLPGMNTYFVPEELGDEFIVMGVEHALPIGVGSAIGNSDSGSGFFMPGGGDLQNIISSLAFAKLGNMMSSQALNPFTFEFLPPNMVRFNNNISVGKMMLIVRTTHRKDFATFPFGMLETIKELAFYDVAMDIYGIRKYFASMRTLFAEINLDMEIFSNIPSERKELIERLKKNQQRYGSTRKIYVA